jgi:ubiquinone/menaquinone biosynthesis C-methylase UbiE
MTSHERKDMWASGASYESYVGRWSRLIARQFLIWLNLPSGTQWLDVGCGTGALSQTILDIASPHKVLGIDSSEGILSLLASRSEIHV